MYLLNMKNINEAIDISIKIGDVAKYKLFFLYDHHMIEGILSIGGKNFDRKGSNIKKNPNITKINPINVTS